MTQTPPPTSASRVPLPTSGKDEWSTPQWLFDHLNRELGPFDLDAAASHANAKIARYFTIADDALTRDWGSRGVKWLNPPYGRGKLEPFMRKAIDTARAGATVVALVPAATDTKWFQLVWQYAAEVWFIEGRIAFGDGRGIAKFPSCVVVFRPPAIWSSNATVTYRMSSTRPKLRYWRMTRLP